eukprot:COSAG05_NODE_425_length_9910_cov_182.503618_7_plen_819_part_00
MGIMQEIEADKDDTRDAQERAYIRSVGETYDRIHAIFGDELEEEFLVYNRAKHKWMRPQNAQTELEHKKSAQVMIEESKERGVGARKAATEQTRMIQAFERNIIERYEASLWDDAQGKMILMEPESANLRVIAAEGMPPVSKYEKNSMFVRVLLNGKLLKNTKCIKENDQPQWAENISLSRVFTRPEVTNTLTLQVWHQAAETVITTTKGKRHSRSGNNGELLAEAILSGQGISAFPRGETVIKLAQPTVADEHRRPPARKGGYGHLTIDFRMVHTPPKRSMGASVMDAIAAPRTRKLDMSFCDIASSADIQNVAIKYAIPHWIEPLLDAANNPRSGIFTKEIALKRMKTKLQRQRGSGVSHRRYIGGGGGGGQRTRKVAGGGSGGGNTVQFNVMSGDALSGLQRLPSLPQGAAAQHTDRPLADSGFNSARALLGLSHNLAASEQEQVMSHGEVKQAPQAVWKPESDGVVRKRKILRPVVPPARATARAGGSPAGQWVKPSPPPRTAGGFGSTTHRFNSGGSGYSNVLAGGHTTTRAFGRGTQSARGAGPSDHLHTETLAFYDTLGALTWEKQWEEKGKDGESIAAKAWVVNSVSLASNALECLDGLSRAIQPFLAYHTWYVHEPSAPCPALLLLLLLSLSCLSLCVTDSAHTHWLLLPIYSTTLQVLDLSCNKLGRLWSKPPSEQRGASPLLALPGDKEEDGEASALPDGLEATPHLHTLYLHGNMLTLKDPRDLHTLGGLKVLRKLSLHGNPCENATHHAGLGYRLSILKVVPQLRELDFTSYTKLERRKLIRHLGKLKGYGATLSATSLGTLSGL